MKTQDSLITVRAVFGQLRYIFDLNSGICGNFYFTEIKA